MSYPLIVWEIDWDKVTKWEDIKELLQCCDMQVRECHPQFDEIKKFCKLIDRDGNRIDPEAFVDKSRK